MGLRAYWQQQTTLGTTDRLEIHLDGYSASAVQLASDDRGIEFEHTEITSESTKGFINPFDNKIQKGKLDFYPFIRTAAQKAVLEDISNAPDNAVLIVWKVDGNVEWKGYANNKLLSYPESGGPFVGHVIADDFEILKGIDFPLAEGRQLWIKTIADLLGFTGFDLPIQTSTSWIVEGGNNSADFLGQVYHDPYALRTYAKTGDETDQPITVWDALIHTCDSALIIKQLHGKILVEQITAFDDPSQVYQTTYDNNGGVLTATAPIDRRQTLYTSKNDGSPHVKRTSDNDGYPGIKRASVKFDHRTKVTNIQFPSDITLDSNDPTQTFQQFIVSDGSQSISLSLHVNADFPGTAPAEWSYKIQAAGYWWNADSNVWVNSTHSNYLSLSGGQLQGGSNYKYFGIFDINTDTLPSDADGSLIITFNRASQGNYANKTYVNVFLFAVNNGTAAQNTTYINYQLTQQQGYSEHYTHSDLWYGDGPVNYARSAISLDVNDNYTSDSWARRGESNYRNFAELVLSETVDTQRNRARKLKADIIGGYDPEMVSEYNTNNFYYVGGKYTSVLGRWEPTLMKVDVQTSPNDVFETINKFSDENTGSSTPGNSGSSFGGSDSRQATWESIFGKPEGEAAWAQEIGVDFDSFLLNDFSNADFDVLDERYYTQSVIDGFLDAVPELSDDNTWTGLNIFDADVRMNANLIVAADASRILLGELDFSSYDPGIVIGRAVAGSGNAHGFVDESHINKTGTIGYNSFDAFPEVFGTQDYDHTVGFQSRPYYRSSGTIDRFLGFQTIPHTDDGTINKMIHFHARDINKESPAEVTAQYGFYIDETFSGGDESWAFYNAGSNGSYFRGPVGFGTNDLYPGAAATFAGDINFRTSDEAFTAFKIIGGTQSGVIRGWNNDGTTASQTIEIHTFGSNHSWFKNGFSVGTDTLQEDTMFNVSQKASIGELELRGDTYTNNFSDWFSANPAGWQISYEGVGDFRQLYIDELIAKTFTVDVAQALAGSDILTKSVGILASSFVVPAVGSSTTVDFEDLPGLDGFQDFEEGDWLRFRVVDRSNGLLVANVYGQVSGYTDQGSGEQSWTFTTDYAAGGVAEGELIHKGALALDYGTSGDTYIERSVLNRSASTDFSKTPYDRIIRWTGSDPRTGSKEVLTQRGNLKGLAGYASTRFGLYASNTVFIGDASRAGNYFEYDNGALFVDAESFDLKAGNDFWRTSDQTGSLGDGIFSWDGQAGEIQGAGWDWNAKTFYNEGTHFRTYLAADATGISGSNHAAEPAFSMWNNTSQIMVNFGNIYKDDNRTGLALFTDYGSNEKVFEVSKENDNGDLRAVIGGTRFDNQYLWGNLAGDQSNTDPTDLSKIGYRLDAFKGQIYYDALALVIYSYTQQGSISDPGSLKTESVSISGSGTISADKNDDTGSLGVLRCRYYHRFGINNIIVSFVTSSQGDQTAQGGASLTDIESSFYLQLQIKNYSGDIVKTISSFTSGVADGANDIKLDISSGLSPNTFYNIEIYMRTTLSGHYNAGDINSSASYSLDKTLLENLLILGTT